MTPIALTVKSTNGIVRVLSSEIEVLTPDNTTSIRITGIWDTGASGTVITPKVIAALGIFPTGIVQVHTANGSPFVNTYTINVKLPNGVLIQGIVATEAPAIYNADALIGMDIITVGDFSITNHNGKTCMSFRTPSLHEIDYVAKPNTGIKQNIPIGSPGSNFTPPKKKKKR